MPFSSEEFDGADVLNFRNKQGHVLVACDITFSEPLDEIKESLIAFHIRTLLAESGWRIPTDQGPVEISVLYYNIKRTAVKQDILTSKCALL